MKIYYKFVTSYPKLVVLIVLAVTLFMALQLDKLEWETDARVYMPKGHPAIEYDEKIERLFGAKDTIVIAIVNQEKTIFNIESLEKIKRITKKISALPSVVANRSLDVASLSTATLFEGDDSSMGAIRLMRDAPKNDAEIEQIKTRIKQHGDILIGNLVSADGSAAMIRAKVKEGAVNRYQAYWQIKGIIAAESGASEEWGGWGGGNWSSEDNGQVATGNGQAWQKWQVDEAAEKTQIDNGDEYYIAGRPAIEVTSGLHALEDIKVMIPLLVLVMSIALFMIFKTGRGVLLPLCVMAGAIIWTMGFQ